MPAGPARAADPLQDSLLRRYAAADAGTVGADGASLLTEDPPSLWLRSRVRAPPAGCSVEPTASAAPDEAVGVADGDVSVEEEAAPSDRGESGPTLFTAVRGFHSDPIGPADRRRRNR